jgi:hypothetical protein
MEIVCGELGRPSSGLFVVLYHRFSFAGLGVIGICRWLAQLRVKIQILQRGPGRTKRSILNSFGPLTKRGGGFTQGAGATANGIDIIGHSSPIALGRPGGAAG